MKDKLKSLSHSESAEQAALGSCLIDPELAVPIIIRNLSIEDFYFDNHRIIYDEIVSFWREEKPIDFVTIAEKLREKDLLKKAGGAKYLSQLINAVAITSNVDYYIGIIKNCSLDRKLEKLISSYKGEEEGNIKEKILDLKTKLTDIENEIPQKITTFKDDIHNVIDEIERQRKLDKAVLSTGILDLDDKIGGLKTKRLIVIGGRPSMGKSTLALNIALNLAENNERVLICSLQLSIYDIILRLLCRMSRISNDKLEMPNKLDDNDWTKIISATNELYQYPLCICDKYLTVEGIESLVQINRPKILIIDFIQQLRLPGPEEDWKKLIQALIDFKRIAKEYDLSAILVSQLSREFDKRTLREPKLSDFAESGGIEQHAELAIIIDWPSKVLSLNPKTKQEWTEEERKLVNIFIAKNNFGSTGKFKLVFDARYYNFQNYAFGRQNA